MVDAFVELVYDILEIDHERATAVTAVPLGQHFGGGAQIGVRDDHCVGAARGRTQLGGRSLSERGWRFEGRLFLEPESSALSRIHTEASREAASLGFRAGAGQSLGHERSDTSQTAIAAVLQPWVKNSWGPADSAVKSSRPSDAWNRRR